MKNMIAVGLTISLIIVLLVATVTSLLIVSDISKEYDELNQTHNELLEEHQDQTRSYQRLIVEHKSLESDRDSLKTENTALASENRALASEASDYKELACGYMNITISNLELIGDNTVSMFGSYGTGLALDYYDLSRQAKNHHDQLC